jgi:hypothetical protein
VIFAGDPGLEADLKPSSFTSDPNHDKFLLKKVQSQYDGHVTLLGYWHKHPPGMNRPSGGDLTQAQELLADLVDDPHPWLLAIIVNFDSASGPFIYPYVLNGSGKKFKSISPIIVDQKSDSVQQALESEPIYRLKQERRSFWSNPNFRFHLTATGGQRLREELELLKGGGYQVHLQQRKDNHRLSLIIERGEDSWLCVPPAEYPLCMPRFFRLPNLTEEFPFVNFPTWNSDLTLADCLTNLRKQPARSTSLNNDDFLSNPTHDSPKNETQSPLNPEQVHFLGIRGFWGRTVRKFQRKNINNFSSEEGAHEIN